VRRDFLLVVDVQEAFRPAPALVAEIADVVGRYPSAGTVELYDEKIVPFRRQLGWQGVAQDRCLVHVDRVFYKYGYLPPDELIAHIHAFAPERVLLAGVQTDTCVLAAAFRLFDEGLTPTLVLPLCQGSSADPDSRIAAKLWEHHFGAVIEDLREL
jgi:nicotinamidase-related amidase